MMVMTHMFRALNLRFSWFWGPKADVINRLIYIYILREHVFHTTQGPSDVGDNWISFQ